MAENLNNLKIGNGVQDELLTTDENGMIKPTGKKVNDLTSKEDYNSLEERVGVIETELDGVAERLAEING